MERRKAKQPLIGLRTLAGALLLVFATGGSAFAQIRNSKHDFSMSGKGGLWGSKDTNQICLFCHIPHKALSTQLLWNRTLPVQAFQIYDSESFDARKLNQQSQPKMRSRLCLTCHDGSTAIDSFREGRIGPPSMMSIGDVFYPGSPWGQGGSNIGGNYKGNSNVNDLRDDHPVSFIYDQALAVKDGSLKDPAALPATLPLYENRLECQTCHDVHNAVTVDGGKYLLRVTLSASALCLSCHVK